MRVEAKQIATNSSRARRRGIWLRRHNPRSTSFKQDPFSPPRNGARLKNVWQSEGILCQASEDALCTNFVGKGCTGDGSRCSSPAGEPPNGRPTAFRFRQQWAEAYFARVSLEAELDRFDLRGDLTEDALGRFQDRVTSIVMSEARSWRDENIKQNGDRPSR